MDVDSEVDLATRNFSFRKIRLNIGDTDLIRCFLQKRFVAEKIIQVTVSSS